ncbi:ion transport peptide-like isoform X3 [Aethina tumida]|nr:ion transport peptide-like isoform X3 [Aethina tumida]XP_019869758.1 ion transport peptide-like isoform X3 [Aethina tumida]XP_019869765.1 ion transport peptide-like isoform X3 [Aethina tumida]XP_019869781.1 ion transport peptide-like isoform X3 [Aethina tumida]XP_019869790.1 ion transport peptide-like isoform X3 [Aethina tumida]XP_019869799.1 ion transport peptide-like isoform X3 [Aethina tumida]XP_049826768.1 ion transport peptide-like isoform X3 [Aethina tumida]
MSHPLSQSVRSTQIVGVCMALALVVQVVVGSPSRSPLLTHHLTKRSFHAIECQGVYDKSIFARLDRICEDCYSLFREPEVHSLCRKDCFTTSYFKGCLDTLQLQDEMEQVQTWIKQLHGADPKL